MPKKSRHRRPSWAERALNAPGHPWKDECRSHKIRYRSEEEATLSAKLSIEGLHAYRCMMCGGWHLTRKLREGG